MKNPLTLAGIEPATFRFVALRLNHCATAVPPLPSYAQPSSGITRRGTQVSAEVAKHCMHLSYESESEVGGKSLRNGNFPTVI